MLSNFNVRVLWLPLLCLLVNACSSSRESSGEVQGAFVVTGTMVFLGVENGCWQFHGDDGKEYEILGTNVDQLEEDGLRAKIRVQPFSATASICMVGTPVELLEIIEIIE